MTNPLRRATSRTLVVGLALTMWPAVSYAQVKVIISGGFSGAYGKLLPEFEHSSGITVTSVDAFRQTLLHAHSVALDSSTTGIYVTTKLFPQLGIAAEMTKKTKTSGAGAVAAGDAEISVQPISEQPPVNGIDIVGKIPDEVQYVAVFSAALVSSSNQRDAAMRLIAFLTSEGAADAIRSSGMEPSQRR